MLAVVLALMTAFMQSVPVWAENAAEGSVLTEEAVSEETVLETTDAVMSEAEENGSDIPEETTEEDESEEPEELMETPASEEEPSRRHNEDNRGGYLPMPGENEAPVVDDNMDYPLMKEELNDSRSDSELLTAMPEMVNATADSRAFPYSYQNDEEIISYLKKYYPDTKDQGNTGTCWAHSSIAMAEFYMISHGMRRKDDTDFSERHLAWWAYTQGTPSIAGDTGDSIRYTGDDGDFGTGIYGVGGNSYMSALTLMQRRGVADESVAPFAEATDLDEWGDLITENDALENSTERQNTAYLKNAYLISRSNKKLIKDTILHNGLVGFSYCNSGDFINHETAAFYCPVVTGTNHAVAIVGWDDDYPRENFDSSIWAQDWWGDWYPVKEHIKPGKDGAWLVRNSWSTDTGIDYYSYFWMSYEDKSMSDIWVYEMMDPTDPDFDNNYFYDSQIHPCNRTSAVKSANIFTASGEADCETLQAVTFDLSFMSSSGVNYKIEIYKGNDLQNPEDGQKVEAATTTGKITLGGMYTIPLEKPVELEKEERFAVVITLSDKKSVNYEIDSLNWSGIEQSVGIGQGQSYIYNGGKWIDFSEKGDGNRYYHCGNLGIHALTANGPAGDRIEILAGDNTIHELRFDTDRKVGDNIQLTAVAFDNDGNKEDAADVSWHSDDRSVVTVENGLVTAVGNGQTEITAYSRGRRTTIPVTVALTEHTVTFDAAGGSIVGTYESGSTAYTAKREFKICHGGTVTIEDPKKTNAIFAGWIDAENNPVDLTTLTVENDLSLSACWTPLFTVAKPIAENWTGSVHPGDQFILRVEGDPDAKIYYTVNGPDPTTESTLYTGPITVQEKSGYFNVRAIAVKKDYADSDVATFDNVIIRDMDMEWGDVLDADRAQIDTDHDGYPNELPSGLWVAEASYEQTVTYTGSDITFPNLRIYHGNKLLVNGRDYTVSYKNNRNVSEGLAAAKKPTITVKGKGNYSGQEKVLFEIAKASLTDANIKVDPVIRETQTGKAIKLVPAIYYNGVMLKNNTDFVCTYPSTGENAYIAPDTYEIRLTGKGNFSSEPAEAITVSLTILPKEGTQSIAKATLKNFLTSVPMSNAFVLEKGGYTQDENALEVRLTRNGEPLEKGTDYSIEYRNNGQAGTATMILKGTGDYTGSLSKTFKIAPVPIKNAGIDFASEVTWGAAAYDAGGVFLDPVITYQGEELAEGTDYFLTYKNNNKAGKATMTVNGKGRFNGSVSKTFTIKGYDITGDPDEAIRIEHTTAYGVSSTYTCEDFRKTTLSEVNHLSSGAVPDIKVYYKDRLLRSGTDYVLNCKNNKTDNWYNKNKMPKVTITGKGGFTGSLSAVFHMTYNPVLQNAVATAPDLVRSAKKNGLFATPMVLYNGVKMKAGKDYSKTYRYEYLYDVQLANNSVRRAGSLVSASDILKEGTSAWIKVTVFDLDHYSSISAIYAVKAGDIGKAKVTVNKGKAFDFNGKAVYPSKSDIDVKIGDNVLGPEDYEIVGYENADRAGSATLTLRGVGDYCGEKPVKYQIGAKKFLWFTLP